MNQAHIVFLGYTNKDIKDLLDLVYPEDEAKSTIYTTQDWKLITFLKDLLKYLEDNDEKKLSMYRSEILNLLENPEASNNDIPFLLKKTGIPSWIIVLFVPFHRVAIYINLGTELYQRLITWRLTEGR
jgi:hypothetical protein